jgi:hypothetical protein
MAADDCTGQVQIGVVPNPSPMSARRIAIVAALALMIGAGQALAAPARSTTPSAVRLPGSVMTDLDGIASTGPLDADRVVQVGVLLTNDRTAAAAAAAKAMYTPGSPTFHHFLTPQQYAAEFGIDGARRAATADWLTSGGMDITFTSGNGTLVLATGTVRTIDRLFDVSMRSYDGKDGAFYANDRAPRVPESLGIDAVVLSNRFPMHTNEDSFPVPVSTTPQDLWSIYDQPAANTGQGQQIALFGWGASDKVASDLSTFEQQNHLPQVPFSVRHIGAPPDPTDTAGLGEWNIDSQASIGMAPGIVHETFYFATSGITDELAAAFYAWADDPNGALQGSASFGGCEDNPVFDAIGASHAAMNSALNQAVLEGRSLFTSTGDTGSGCIAAVGEANGVLISPVPLQEMPAVSPYAIAVGGTVLYTDQDEARPQRTREIAWTHGGGGSSAFVRRPDFQADVANVNGPCDDDPTAICRGVPDVSAQSGDLLSGYDIISDGQPSTGAGTSLSSPLWVGMWARMNAASTGGLGFANPALYSLVGNADTYARDFYDVTIGANGRYVAGTGWDYTTGWGVPDVTHLIEDLNGGSITPTNPDATYVPPATTVDSCSPLWRDPAGDDAAPGTANGSTPQDDLLSSTMSMRADGSAIEVAVKVSKLSTEQAQLAQSTSYTTEWTVDGVSYYATAELADGKVTYTDGSFTEDDYVVVTSTTPEDKPTTGTFDTATSTITIDVPLDHIGNPAPGTVLTTPSTTVSVVDDPVTGLSNTVDTGGPGHDFVVGPCTQLPTGEGDIVEQTPAGGGGATTFTRTGDLELSFVSDADGVATTADGYQLDAPQSAPGTLSPTPGTVGHVAVAGFMTTALPGEAPITFAGAPVGADTIIGGALDLTVWVQNEGAENAATELDATLVDVAADGTERTIVVRGPGDGAEVVGGDAPTRVDASYPIDGGWVLAAGHHLELRLVFPYVVGSTTRLYYGDATYASGMTLGVDVPTTTAPAHGHNGHHTKH